MKKKVNLILVHILLWLVYFSFNFLFVKNYRVDFDVAFQLKTWCVQVILFYINYFFLVPYLLFKNKTYLFIALSILLLASSFYAKTMVDERFFKGRFRDGRGMVQTQPDFPLPDSSYLQSSGKPEQPFNERNISHPHVERRRSGMPWNIIPLTSLLLVYFGSLSLSLMLKWQKDEKRNSEIEKEKITNELTFLKQQINPHFLFNSLNSIYSLSMTKSPETTETILKLSSILRYILYEGEKKTVPLTDEIDTLKNYIDLQRLRITKNVNIQFSIRGEYDDLRIEPLLLLPLIENAFKHGIDNVQKSDIDINVKIEDGELKILISNLKIKKINKKELINGEGGIGLKNIQRRLELVYPKKYLFDIKDYKDLFSVYLQVNLR